MPDTSDAKPYCVYSKLLLNVSDYVGDLPFERDVECATIHDARIEAERLTKLHPARFYFAGFNVGPIYNAPNPWNQLE